jgi:hypothetical protein
MRTFPVDYGLWVVASVGISLMEGHVLTDSNFKADGVNAEQ